MKKKPKFFVFGLKSGEKPLVFLMCFFSLALLTLLFFLTKASTPEAVSAVVLSGTKGLSLPSDKVLTKAALRLSLPSLTYSAEEKEPSSDPTELTADSLPAPLPDSSQSVTYRTAEEKGYVSSNGIYINNQTDLNVDIDTLLNAPLPFSLSDGPSVLIVHTHTSESYTPSEKFNFVSGENDRTRDTNFNMAAVGDEVYQRLSSAGINVLHDKSINDYPSYSGSYSKSLKLVQSYIEKYPSVKVVLDIHRDAVIKADGTKLKTVAEINGETAAQVMIVVGTDQSGLEHSAWQQNMTFALKLQHKMNTLYPSLARPINLRKQRFNQHTAPGALIIEIGTNGNTLDEALKGAALFSDALAEVLKD